MKIDKINIKRFSFLAALFVLLVFAACEDEETLGLPPSADLETLMSEAQDLIANSEEGTSPGNFQPGSKQTLQNVLTWVDWQIANAAEEKDIDNAAIRLQKSIDKFKVSTVKLAIPIFDGTTQSYIKISDNIKSKFSESFTLEIETYYLGPAWLQNLVSMEGDDGAPFGFSLRIFGGNLDLVVGNGGWAVASAAGAFKVGEWVHYAITNDGNTWKVYMDGTEVISLDAPGMIVKESFAIGNGSFWGDRPWKGLTRDFRLWSGVRTADQLIANKDEQLEGTEEGLVAYFPMDANLGNEFKDNTGTYTATFVSTGVAWAPDGIPPVIELDFTALDAAIASAESFKTTLVEGTEDGDFPIGSKDYIQAVIDAAKDTKESAEKQDQLDGAIESIENAIDMIENNPIADAMGVYVDRDDPDAIGFQITPNYTPQGSYTVEFDLKLKTLQMGGSGEIFGNGSFGLRVFGYTELTEEEFRNAGGLWNFTNANNAWEGPSAPPLTMKSGEWQHVAIVHDDVAKSTIIVVDGEEVGRQDDFGAPLESGWGEIWLGNSWGSKMNGTIKDFRIWDEAREMGDLNADIDGSEANLHMYFPLDKVAGVSFKDVTGNYNGNLRGIVWEK